MKRQVDVVIDGARGGVIKKHNYLVEASYKLSLNEVKIIHKAISDLRDNDTVVRISVSEFMSLVESGSKNTYSQIKTITRELMRKIMTIKEIDTRRELQVAWFASVDYKNGEGYVELEFSKKLIPYILEVKNRFTILKLETIVKFSSVYTFRIYELLKQYQPIGERTFDLEELKKILSCTGKGYALYSNFKQRVILQAQRELAEKTDICFDFEEIKVKRKVTRIKFKIYPNVRPEPEQPPMQQEQEQGQERPAVYGQTGTGFVADKQAQVNRFLRRFFEKTGVEFSASLAMKMIDAKGIDTVDKYLDNWDKFKTAKVGNVAGFFYKAVMDSYSIPKSKNRRPANMANFKEREYSDEYFKNFFEDT